MKMDNITSKQEAPMRIKHPDRLAFPWYQKFLAGVMSLARRRPISITQPLTQLNKNVSQYC